MDEARLSRLLIKIAGLVIVVFAVATSPSYVQHALSAREVDASLWFYFVQGMLPILLPLLLGVLMFLFPSEVARRSIGIAKLEAGRAVDSLAVEAIAYAVLGAYLLVEALVDATFLFGKLHLYRTYAGTHGYNLSAGLVPPEDFARICGAGVELILALALILGASGFATLRRKVVGLRESA
jgi:hypothetical protein